MTLIDSYKGEAATRVQRAKIPPLYAHASFENFETNNGNDSAAFTVKLYAEQFQVIPIPPYFAEPPGLLLTGPVGTGKTHLAVAAMKRLIHERGITARFADVREMLDRLRSSYSENAQESQGQILKPLLESDLVVIDDLGSSRQTDWAFEMVELLISQLYNRMTRLIVTTNLPNLPPAGTGGNAYDRSGGRMETLGDRIGLRMWSRLQQMCIPVGLSGADYRVSRRPQ